MDEQGPIRVLMLDLAPPDASRCEAELRKAGLPFAAKQVPGETALLEELRQFPPSVILASDEPSAAFGPLPLLHLVRSQFADLPVIFLADAAREEAAVELIRSGATDYVLKNGFARLAPAVQRALNEAAERLRRRRAEQALRDNEERYALAAQGTNDGIWDWDLTRDLVHYSPRWKEMLGCGDADVGTEPDEWFRRIHPDDAERVRAEIQSHVDGLTRSFESEHRLAHKTAGYRWMLARGLALRGADGRAYRMAGSQSDITARKADEERLIHTAFHDHLTGLPNRALFLDRLTHCIRRARRHPDARFAVLFLDVDRFKLFNDSFGHSFGDILLREVSRRVRSSIRPGDTVARMGGDEFAVLLEECDEPAARVVAERIHKVLATPVELGSKGVYATTSIGIALGMGGDGHAEDLVRDADTAMYESKAKGRDRTEVFNASMHARSVRTLSIDAELRRALERSELAAYYQPIVALDSGRIVGFEALIRWLHPSRGVVPAAEFIPVAEETGLICALDRWVISAACRQVAQWRRSFGQALYVSVNLSAKEFARTDVLDYVQGALRETDSGGLCVEVTESVLMSDSSFAVEVLHKLKGSGVSCYLDDFGTGYSSLSYLHRLPIDALKIDQSFVRGMGDGGDSVEIVRTIAALGRNLRKLVIAEGVESAEHLDALRAMGCTHAQGYWFARPLTSEAAGSLLAAPAPWAGNGAFANNAWQEASS